MRIGFVSTRFFGTDGVSLEAAKWVHVLEKELGHECFWFAGQLDTPEDRSHLCELAFFEHPEIFILQRTLFGLKHDRPPEISALVKRLKCQLKDQLRTFVEKFDIELLIPQNILAIPMNVPLGLAITELIEEMKMPTVAHHHDFVWERGRFLHTSADDYLGVAFPPPFKEKFQHAVINSMAVEGIKEQRGVDSTVVPNVFDFETPPETDTAYAEDFRREAGIANDEIVVLQPTRIVPRKGIELSIELLDHLQQANGRKYCLLVSHRAGDEGYEYQDMLERLAKQRKVRVIWFGDRIGHEHGKTEDGKRIYRLWDIYPHADLVAYPSIYEGFGNAFLEAVYFRKPIVVNRYQVYIDDIEPCGFKTVHMDGTVDAEVVERTRFLLENPDVVAQWCDHNYEVALKHFSYATLREKLRGLLERATG
ncbi:glycosyltransferase family 4 protein [Arenicella sp.]|nr:glycosyltransferase family 4 protein [Arenicella sp.]